MTQEQLDRGLRLVRYGGVVVTVTVLVVLFAFMFVIGNSNGISGMTLSAGLPYIIGFTVLAAVLSVVLYFAYRMYGTQRLQKAS